MSELVVGGDCLDRDAAQEYRRTWVVRLSPSSISRSTPALQPEPFLRTSASVAGDVDGDGHADLIVGSSRYSPAANGAGRAYLYSGSGGKLLKTWTMFLITSAWSGIHGFHSGRLFVISSGVNKK